MFGRLGRVLVAMAIGLAGLIVVQMLRLRRMEFLPLHPGFYVSHQVEPRSASDRLLPPLRVLTFGDSTTAGVGVDRAEESLPMVLAQHLADARGRRVRVLNFGWSGARMEDLVRDQVARAGRPLREGEQPWLPTADLVVMVVGANDATHATAPNRFRAALRSVLETVQREAPRAEVVVAGIPLFRGALHELEPLMSIVDAYGVLLRRIQHQEAQRAGVHYADLRTAVPRLAAAQGLRIDDVLASDNFHPSARGYRIWGDAIFDALTAGASRTSGRGP